MNTTRYIEELSMVEARRELTRLPERLAAQGGTVTVMRRGRPVLAIMTWDDYETLQETLEILSDSEAVTALRQALREMDEGKAIPWEEAKASLRGL